VHIDECGRLRTVRSTHPARSASGVEDGAIREGSPVQSVRGPEVLEIVDLPDPHPGPGQVRIAVRAAGVNASDWESAKA
jgi:hypothetical protein